MHNIGTRSLALVAAFVLGHTLFSLAQASSEKADVIVTHARVYTVNAKQPWAEAVAVREGKIIAVGSEQEIATHKALETKVIDAGGRVVLPGFTDCHVHFMSGSIALTGVILDDAKTVEEYQKRVKEYATAHPEAAWILGRGWTYPAFGATALPDKKYLDAVVPDRPVLLEGYDGHTYWANSKALELAHIDKNTPDPPNGVIVRDAQTSEATGALKEAAQDLVEKMVPVLTREQRLAALRCAWVCRKPEKTESSGFTARVEISSISIFTMSCEKKESCRRAFTLRTFSIRRHSRRKRSTSSKTAGRLITMIGSPAEL